MTTIAFITTAIIAFAAGIVVGFYFTCKALLPAAKSKT
jgi:uncharacterized protein YneF (UPF0154 family)